MGQDERDSFQTLIIGKCDQLCWFKDMKVITEGDIIIASVLFARMSTEYLNSAVKTSLFFCKLHKSKPFNWIIPKVSCSLVLDDGY